MDFLSLIISLASGAAGGNAAGAAIKENSLGTLGNSIAGLVGGAAGGYIVQALGFAATIAAASSGHAEGPPGGGIDFGALLANVGASGVGGALLTAIAGYLKNNFFKSQ